MGNTVVRDENKPLAQTAGHYFGVEQDKAYWGKIDVADKLEIVRINGQNINLLPSAPPPHNDADFRHWHSDNNEHDWHAYIGVHLQHARYGMLNKMPGLDDDKAYLFAQGNVSTSLPARNGLTYRGRGLVLAFDKKKSVDAVSEFTVNFLDKNLSGKLSPSDGSRPVQLSADIQGSHFSSKDKSAVEVKGAFYGADAAEMAGVFRDTGQNIGGAFGAKKQQ